LKPRGLSTAVLLCLAVILSGCSLGNLPGAGGPGSTTLYAATAAGVSASLTGGSSWKTIGSLANVNNVEAVSSGTYISVYASTTSGLYVSTDGATWSLYTGLTGPVYDAIVSGLTIYAATGAGVYFSASLDPGTTWTSVPGSASVGIFLVGATIYAATGSSGLSVYSGTAWSSYTTPGLPSNNVACVFDDGTNVYAGTSDAGLAVAANTSLSPWTVYNAGSGLAGNNVQGIFVYNGSIYAATSAGLSVYNGSAWTTYLSGVSVNSVYVFGSSIYAATASGVWVSLNSGTSWSDETTAQGLASNTVSGISVQ